MDPFDPQQIKRDALRPHGIQAMRDLAAGKGGECLSEVYTNLQTKLLWRCAKGHEWEAKPSAVKRQRTWCPKCARVGRKPHNKKTPEERLKDVQRHARSKGGRCLAEHYESATTHMPFECKKGHKWTATVNCVVDKGTWCPTCGCAQPIGIEAMQELAKKKGGECLSPTYKNLVTKLRWRCSEGHEWMSAPYVVRGKGAQKGSWCPTCAGNGGGKPLGLDAMQLLAASHGGTCVSTEYKNFTSYLRWRCKHGHEWETTPYVVKVKGYWCPTCRMADRAMR